MRILLTGVLVLGPDLHGFARHTRLLSDHSDLGMTLTSSRVKKHWTEISDLHIRVFGQLLTPNLWGDVAFYRHLMVRHCICSIAPSPKEKVCLPLRQSIPKSSQYFCFEKSKKIELVLKAPN